VAEWGADIRDRGSGVLDRRSSLFPIGFAASTRGHTVASNENLIESRKVWEAKIIRIEERLDRLGTPRPANVIEAEIDGLLRTPGAEGCQTINGPVTREICPKVDRLHRELAASKETARLEADLVADRRALSGLPQSASTANPQAAMLNRLSGFEEETIRNAIGVLIAFLVELGSALGFTFIILAARSHSGICEAKPVEEADQLLTSSMEAN
jgi:hypothetical protein